MNKHLLLLILCASFWLPLPAQNQDECTEIKVEARISQNTIYLDFSSGLKYDDFKISLYAQKRADNRLNLVTKEIKDLPKGTYLLVIQDRNGDKFCPKKFNLKIE